MKTSFDTGLNRTGMATSPIQAPQVTQGAREGKPSSPGDSLAIGKVRAEYAREAEPIGSVPPPASIKGAVKTALKALQGEKATVFIDKLGERAGFERTGVRLYELVLSKLDAFPSWQGGPTREELLEIQRDELRHFGVVVEAIRKLGGDPTVMTPSADLVGVLSMGLPQALADPRTDVRQCLEGILVAELTDNACWETLIALGRELGQDELVGKFEEALQAEARHLVKVRGWVRQGVLASAEFKGPAKTQAERPSAPA